MPAKPSPIVVHGKTYHSQQAAADDLNLSRQAIHMAKMQGRLDTVGLNPRGKSHGRRVTLDGKTYESIYQLARDVDLPYHRAREYFR